MATDILYLGPVHVILAYVRRQYCRERFVPWADRGCWAQLDASRGKQMLSEPFSRYNLQGTPPRIGVTTRNYDYSLVRVGREREKEGKKGWKETSKYNIRRVYLLIVYQGIPVCKQSEITSRLLMLFLEYDLRRYFTFCHVCMRCI